MPHRTDILDRAVAVYSESLAHSRISGEHESMEAQASVGMLTGSVYR